MASNLLGLDSEEGFRVLVTCAVRVVVGNIIKSPIPVHQACAQRDAVARALYSKVFDWIIWKINQSIKIKEKNDTDDLVSYESKTETERYRSIGILDIFGFESGET